MPDRKKQHKTSVKPRYEHTILFRVDEELKEFVKRVVVEERTDVSTYLRQLILKDKRAAEHATSDMKHFELERMKG